MKYRGASEMMIAQTNGAKFFIVLAGIFYSTICAFGADDLTYLQVVQRYADTMIEQVRDVYGAQKSGLLLSAFDRSKMAPLTTRPAPPGGVRRGDRAGEPWTPLVGANPQTDQNLLRVLYTLSELTGDKKYAQTADAELKWFFNHAQSPATSLMAWGEHLSWDVMKDKAISGGTARMHEFARPWVLWDRSYALAPEACKRFALGIWNHQIANHKTGGFDRHADYDKSKPVDGKDFARHAGFYIHTWAYAYKHTKDEIFLKAIEVLLNRFDKIRGFDKEGNKVATIGPLDVHTASTLVPDPLSTKLRKFAEREDELILKAMKEKPNQRGLLPASIKATWKAGYSSGVTASRAMFYLARYDQVRRSEYRDLLIQIADAYVNTRPAEDVDVWPMSFGHVISTQVAAYRFTKKKVYLDEACRFAQMAIDVYWQDNPLPRSGMKTGHYETISGADTLALALLDVHAAVNGIETPIPQNTIDR